MTVHPHDDVAHNILNEQRGHGRPSVNMPMECQGCGESYSVKHFKEHGQASADPDEPVLCAVCNAGLASTKSVEERQENNRELADFA